jgi:hypothetical protein
MHNPYLQYYKNQAGSGISGFDGVRYQRGHGLFGRDIGKIFFPVLKFLGRHLLNTGINFASDVIENDLPIKEAFINRGRAGVKDIASEGLEIARKYQRGGRRRRANIQPKKRTKSIKRRAPKRKKRPSLFSKK